jgi:hypothetical protein
MRWLVFAAAVVVNVLAVYAPSDVGGGAALPYADKLAHVLLFAAVSFTGRRAGVPGGPLLALLATHAITSEVVQGVLLAGRSGDPWDAVADLTGTLVGYVMAGVGGRAGG